MPFSLSLCMESTSYVLSFRMVFFLPCDHGLNFWHQLMWEFNQNQKILYYTAVARTQEAPVGSTRKALPLISDLGSWISPLAPKHKLARSGAAGRYFVCLVPLFQKRQRLLPGEWLFDPTFRVLYRAVLMGTKSCTKILILPKIFPTRFRFTFYG